MNECFGLHSFHIPLSECREDQREDLPGSSFACACIIMQVFFRFMKTGIFKYDDL